MMKSTLRAALPCVAAALLSFPALASDGRGGEASHLKVVGHIPGSDGSWDYANLDPIARRLYVARGDGVMAVDLISGRAERLYSAQKVHSAAPLAGGELLVTVGGDNTAVIINARTGVVRATMPTGPGPDAAIIEPKSGLAVVVEHKGGNLTVIDTKAGVVVGSIVVGGTLEFAATDGEGRVFVNVENTSEIAVVDVQKRTVVERYKLEGCDEPSGLAYVRPAHALIAACGNGVAKAVSARDGRDLGAFQIGKFADAVLYDPARRMAYIPSALDGQLTVIGVQRSGHLAVIEHVATMVGARTGAVDPRSGRIYLPTARYGLPATPGGRPMTIPGTFEILIIGKN